MAYHYILHSFNLWANNMLHFQKLDKSSRTCYACAPDLRSSIRMGLWVVLVYAYVRRYMEAFKAINRIT